MHCLPLGPRPHALGVVSPGLPVVGIDCTAVMAMMMHGDEDTDPRTNDQDPHGLHAKPQGRDHGNH